MSNDAIEEGLTEEEQEGRKEPSPSVRSAADIMADRFVEDAKEAGFGIFVVVADSDSAIVSMHVNPRVEHANTMINGFPGAVSAFSEAMLQTTATYVKREVLKAERERVGNYACQSEPALPYDVDQVICETAGFVPGTKEGETK